MYLMKSTLKAKYTKIITQLTQNLMQQSSKVVFPLLASGIANIIKHEYN